MPNYYLEEFNKLLAGHFNQWLLNDPLSQFLTETGQWRIREHLDQWRVRDELVRKYSWAVPSEAAIKHLVSLSPLIEIGAGTGYWAYLIREAGGEIVAFDEFPYCNDQANNKWSEVLKGDENKVLDFPNHTLFLCWPPNKSPMAYNCLKNYKGDKLVFVGEYETCCADDDFFKLLEKDYLGRIMEIPSFMGIHDVFLEAKKKY